MIYTLNRCTVCGSENIKEIDRKNINDNEIVIYKCLSCSEIVSDEKKATKVEIKKEIPITKYEANELFKLVTESIIEIYCKFGEDTGAGTGFIINNNYILTNAHVVLNKNETTESMELFDEAIGSFDHEHTTHELEFISADPFKDIAILKLNKSLVNPLKFAESIETGDKVFAIGNAKGQGLSIVDGIVSDSCRYVDNQKYILFSAPVNHGNSGGPIFNDKSEIVGMVTWGRTDANLMNYAIPFDELINFIKLTEEKEEVKIL